MSKITVVLCDVKPCKLPAEREFEVSGEKVHVCGENCFVRYWSREYTGWKSSPYRLRAFQEFQTEYQSSIEPRQNIDVVRSDLHFIKLASQNKKYV